MADPAHCSNQLHPALHTSLAAVQVAQLQAEAREAAHLQRALADKEGEAAGLRAHLEEALREELADSDPARLRAAQKRAAALEADLAAKQVLLYFEGDKLSVYNSVLIPSTGCSAPAPRKPKLQATFGSPDSLWAGIGPLQGVYLGKGQLRWKNCKVRQVDHIACVIDDMIWGGACAMVLI